MAKVKTTLSTADKLLIESYKTTMEGLAAYYGDAFEFVLHDLTNYNRSIVKIVNGHHSGRKEGGPITDFALQMLEQIQKSGASAKVPYTSYVSASKYGKPVRSTTIVIFGEKKTAIGLLCINLYLDSPISSLLQNFSITHVGDYVGENFSSDSNELVIRTLERVRKEVESDSSVSPYLKNKEIIVQLYHQGIFKLKNAVSLVSKDMGISKNTVYLHLRSSECNSKN